MIFDLSVAVVFFVSGAVYGARNSFTVGARVDQIVSRFISSFDTVFPHYRRRINKLRRKLRRDR